jgi:hypothetical protein
MVHVEFWRPGSEIGRSACVATLTQEGPQQPQIAGPEPQVVDLERVVLSVRAGKAIGWQDHPEEWARSLTGSYRSAYLLAELAHDDDSGQLEIGQHDPDEQRLVVRRGENRDPENV